MPLGVFASAIEDGMSVSIGVDKTIADFTINGQFNGTIESILDDLHKRYGINHSVVDGVYILWRDSDFSSQVSYQFHLSDMDIVSFLNYLSQAAGYRLLADTSIDINLNGAFSGTLREIIENLSNQYPVLFYVSEDAISIVPESSFTKTVVLVSDDNYSSETFLAEVRTDLPPGNFINREDNQLIVGGHPDFVKITESQLRIDMFDSASQSTELLTSQISEMTDEIKNTDSSEPELYVPYRFAAGPQLALAEKSDVLASILDIELLLSPNQDTGVALPHKTDVKYELTPMQDVEVVALTPKEGPEPAIVSNEDGDTEFALSSKENPEFVLAPTENSEFALTPKEDAGIAPIPEVDSEVALVLNEDPEVELVPYEDPEDELVPYEDPEFALTPNEDTEFALTLELDAVVALIPKLDTAFVLPPKRNAGLVLTPKQDAKFALPPEHDAEFALASILDTKFLLPPKQDTEFALSEKQDAEFALSPESEVEVAISVLLHNEIAVSAEPEVVAFTIRDAEVVATAKRDAKAEVVAGPDREVGVMSQRDAEDVEMQTPNDEGVVAAELSIKVAETLEPNDTDLSVMLKQDPEATVILIPDHDGLSLEEIPGFY